MRAVIEAVRPGASAALSADPIRQLAAWPGIAVMAVPPVETDGGCSVAGGYFADVDPPVLAVADDASRGRRAFTVLHEFGHHLQQTQSTLMAVLLAEPDRGTLLEEAACDAFAADVLIPGHLVDQHIGGGVTAASIADLWRATSASRAAVCVRAAQRLTTPGHVVLVDTLGVVQFAATHGLPPIRRGSRQGHIPVVRDALTSTRRRAHGRTRMAYRDGITGQELIAAAADIGDYLVLVAVTDHATWESGFHLPPGDAGPRPTVWICEHCEHEFGTFDRACSRCRSYTCPACGRCSCAPAVAERRCEKCCMVLPARLFAAGSARCSDCA